MGDEASREWQVRQDRVREFESGAISADVPCPQCNRRQSKVVDSRGTVNGSVRRRRVCSCGRRFTTYERIGKDARGLNARLARLELLIEDLRDVVEAERAQPLRVE